MHKLQLIGNARKLCPHAVVVLGEDLTRFRAASKALYDSLKGGIWGNRAERLGLDEVFLDVTEMIDHNLLHLNLADLRHSFFQTAREDPTCGFIFDATAGISGCTYPATWRQAPSSSPSPLSSASLESDALYLRLLLGSHLAQHLRRGLEHEHGYTSTVGISTSKLLSKLVGNVNKPRSQTTLVPPYVSSSEDGVSHVTSFIDAHDIEKIPGIGFKMGPKIRRHILGRPADGETGLSSEGPNEHVSVHDVRCFPGMGPEMLEQILTGPGSRRGIGGLIWSLINGVDDSIVALGKRAPSQISIEDSYKVRLNTMQQVRSELLRLSRSLLKRVQHELIDRDGPNDGQGWIAYPKSLRISTRPSPRMKADACRAPSFARISRMEPMPTFVLSLTDSVDSLAERLVTEALVPQFRRLHPARSGWDLALLNVAVMIDQDNERRPGPNRDIARMFHGQDAVLREWKVEDRDVPPDHVQSPEGPSMAPADVSETRQEHSDRIETRDFPEFEASVVDPHRRSPDTGWDGDPEEGGSSGRCAACAAVLPLFAMAAHDRFHLMEG